MNRLQKQRWACLIAAIFVTATTGGAIAPVQLSVAQEEAYDAPWVDETPRPPERSPYSRFSGAMAYHPGSKRIVLFSGSPGSLVDYAIQRPDDTWTWDGSQWRQEQPQTSPAGRTRAHMAYHPGSGHVVLFGGESGTGQRLGDTWTWDGSNWTNVTPAPAAPGGPPTSPSPRSLGTLAQDRSGKLILFGGNDSTNRRFDDTWAWDGSRWTNVTPAPAGPGEPPTNSPPRSDAGMAYHAPTEKTVLYGGHTRGGGKLNDTWTWDGSKWTEESPATKPSKDFAPRLMGHHAGAGQVVLFGTNTLSGYDTWTWNGTAWQLRSPPTNPPDSGLTGLAYHPLRERVVLLTGFSSYGSSGTWTWDARKIASKEIGTAPAQVNVSLEPASIPADSAASSTVQITVRSAAGIGVPNLNVSLRTDGDVDIAQNPAVERGGGVYESTITASSTPGESRLTAVAETKYQRREIGRGSAFITETPVFCGEESGQAQSWTDLDTTFGCGGKVSTFTDSARTGQDMVLQPDGRMLVTSRTHVLRYLKDGQLDSTSYGTNGAAALGKEGSWRGIALQPDGTNPIPKSVVAGMRISGGSKGFLLRLDSRGKLDPGFGAGGAVEMQFPSLQGDRCCFDVEDVAVQEDRKIVVVGMVQSPRTNVDSDFAMARFFPDGKPDEDFGRKAGEKGDGLVITKFPITSKANGIAIQKDGKILLGGYAGAIPYFTNPGYGDIALARYTRDGFLDPSFNPCPSSSSPACNGLTMTSGGPGATIFYENKIAIQADRKIVVSGTIYRSGQTGIALARFNVGVNGEPDGTLDRTFNPCGDGTEPPCEGIVATYSFPGWQPRGDQFGTPPDGGYAEDMAIQNNGKIVVGGTSPKFRGDFLLARYTSGGLLDDCTGPGFVRTTIGGPEARIMALAVQPEDDMIVAAGFSGRSGANYGTAIARYMGGSHGSPQKVSVESPPPVPEPASGTVKAEFKIKLDQPACEPLTVNAATVDGSATADQDFKPAKGQVEFAKGQQEKAVPVEVLADDEIEGKEEFQLDISDARLKSGGADTFSIPVPRAQATILDSTPPRPLASVGNVVVPESYTGEVPASFTVTLSKRHDKPVSVRYATQDGTAQAGEDYAPASGALAFAAGETAKTVTVKVAPDRIAEPTENFFLNLLDPSGAALGDSTGEAKILDARPGVSVGDVTVFEGNQGTTPATFTLTSNSAADAVTVDYSTEAGTATPGEDFAPARATLAFEPGQTARQVTVDVSADTTVELDENFSLVASNVAGSSLARPIGEGLIKNDDGLAPGPNLVGPGAAGVLPANLPPPQTIPASQTQVQGQSQSQAQAQAQSQAQAQAQMQQHLQSQTQVGVQAGLMAERQQEAQVQKVGIEGKQPGPRQLQASAQYAASTRTSTALPGAFALLAGLLGFGLALGRRTPEQKLSHVVVETRKRRSSRSKQ